VRSPLFRPVWSKVDVSWRPAPSSRRLAPFALDGKPTTAYGPQFHGLFCRGAHSVLGATCPASTRGTGYLTRMEKPCILYQEKDELVPFGCIATKGD